MKNGDDAFLKAPLVFTPGSRWGYGISYGWLGKAIEAISGLTWMKISKSIFVIL